MRSGSRTFRERKIRSLLIKGVKYRYGLHSGPPRLAEQEHRDMLRSLAVALNVLFRLTLLTMDHKKKQKHKKEKNISHRGWESIGNITTLSNEEGKTQIEERIFNIRGKQVMIDKDLALLYGVETKRLNEQVKRNIERFPEDFMFQLTLEECLRSQIATLNQAQPSLSYSIHVADH